MSEHTAILIAMITAGPAMVTAMVAVLVQGMRLGKRLRTVEDHTSTAATELTANHGSSAKDAVTFAQHALERLEEGQQAMAKDIGGIRSEMRTERVERVALAGRVATIEERRRATDRAKG